MNNNSALCISTCGLAALLLFANPSFATCVNPREWRTEITCAHGNPGCPTEADGHRRLELDGKRTSGIDAPAYKTRRLYFGSNRALVRAELMRDYPEYSRAFSNTGSSELSVGWLDVSIPKDHKPGTLETPSIFTGSSPLWNFIVVHLHKFDQNIELSKALSDELIYCSDNDLHIYIHGVDNSFVDPALRLAQLLTDIEYDNPGVVFSWPADGTIWNPIEYAQQSQNAGHSYHQYAQFISLVTSTEASGVFLLGHSHGANILLAGMHAFHAAAVRDRVRFIILAHSDIKVDTFGETYGTLLGHFKHKTFLFNSNDTVLKWKDKLIGESQTAGRRSDAPNACVVVLHSSGHSAFAEEGFSLANIKTLKTKAREGTLDDYSRTRCASGFYELGKKD